MLKRSTGNADLDNNTAELDDRLKVLEGIALLRGRHIADVALPNAVQTKVRHQLGRTPFGYLTAGMTGAAAAGYINVIRRDNEILTLEANGFGATIVLAMWVY